MEHPMNSGDGSFSYAKSSSYQKAVADTAKELVNEVIAQKLDINAVLSSTKTFNIADLGCSIGPNTFFAVQNIIEAVKLKCHNQEPAPSQLLEFHVFFNDHISNDFNTLFRSFPPNRNYYASATPGSFHCRLFPRASLHFVHCSYAIHWLSRVPKEVVDDTSPAWNKGRIHYSASADEVAGAYAAQHAQDMDMFLRARAQEIVTGGLMVLVVSGRPDGTPHSQTLQSMTFDLLGSCLMDMAKKGIINEHSVDSFNIPIYWTSPQEVEAAVEYNGCFSIERMENLPRIRANKSNVSRAQFFTTHIRAVMEGLIGDHFGHQIVDDLFALETTDTLSQFNKFSCCYSKTSVTWNGCLKNR